MFLDNRLYLGQSSINQDFAAGHLGGIAGCQEQYGFAGLFGLTPAAHGNGGCTHE